MQDAFSASARFRLFYLSTDPFPSFIRAMSQSGEQDRKRCERREDCSRSFAVTFSHKPIVFGAAGILVPSREKEKERRRRKGTRGVGGERTAAECHKRMEEKQERRRILAYVRSRTCARHRDALSNVLFISVEQSLPVYPEDISGLVALCTQRCTPLPRAST